MKSRKYRQIRFIILLLLVIFLISFSFNYTISKGDNTEEFETYVVQRGDTLWKIAKNHNYDKIDVREVIYNIQQANEIGSIIHAGQKLKIPTN